MTWIVETWGSAVDAEIEALPLDIRAKLERFRIDIERNGPMSLPKPYAKFLGNGLWELRLSGRDGIVESDLHNCCCEARNFSPRLCKENAENTASRIKAGTNQSMDVDDMTKLSELSKKWFKDPAFVKAHDDLEEEFVLIGAMMEARSHSGLSQAQLARKMKTTQSVIARLEGGKANPSTRTLFKLAAATGTKLKISFEAVPKRGLK